MENSVTTDTTLVALFAAVKASDIQDDLLWLVLADRLDELSDTRAELLRWWREKRADIFAPLDWDDRTSVDWENDIGPRINRFEVSCPFPAHLLFSTEVSRLLLTKCHLTDPAVFLEELGKYHKAQILIECYVLGLASEAERDSASSIIESVYGLVSSLNPMQSNLTAAQSAIAQLLKRFEDAISEVTWRVL